MTKQIRQRCKVHTGTEREVAMDLADFGIKKKHLPESMGGEVNNEHFQEWVSERIVIETEREKQVNIGNCATGPEEEEMAGDV
jgi:hypothetical protein